MRLEISAAKVAAEVRETLFYAAAPKSKLVLI